MAKSKTQYRATGRRKEAIVTVILTPGSGKRTVNGHDFKGYFHSDVQNMIAELPFTTLEVGEQWDVVAKACGGGISGQVGAMRLALSRALIKINEENRTPLKVKGFLTRDSRVVERNKYGRKKARKKPQFSKR
jgi:small subunit ribosomal protein S9